MVKQLLACILLVTLLGGCSGGSKLLPAGSGSSSPAGAPGSRAQAALATATFTITIPAKPSNLKAAYISSATRSISIAANGSTLRTVSVSPPDTTCTPDGTTGDLVCTVTVQVAPGPVTFTVTLFDGSGTSLATGTVPANIQEAQENQIDIELGGVAASITLTPGTSAPAIGTAQVIPLVVVARDAAGQQIIGPYSDAIALTDSDTGTSTLTLSPLSLTLSSTPVSIAYDGAGTNSETFCASTTGVTPVCVTITPVLAVQSVVVSPAATAVPRNGTVALSATVALSDGTTEPAVSWSSADASIASVDQGGVVTGVTEGSVTITATSTRDTGKSGTATVTVVAAPGQPPASLQVQSLTSANVARCCAGGAMINGKIYVTGGLRLSPRGDLTDMEAYDIQNNTWASLAPMPTQRHSLGVAAINGRLYAAGGNVNDTTGGATNVLEMFDPATNTWQSRPAMSVARWGVSAAPANGLFYVVGGQNGSNNLGTVEVYDPLTNTWLANNPNTGTPWASLAAPTTSTAAVALGGKLYVIGGFRYDLGNVQINTLQVFDPTTNTWQIKAPMPRNSAGHAAAALGGRIYVVGGGNDIAGKTNSIEEYNPATDTWRTLSSNPAAAVRSDFVLASSGDRLYGAGGVDNNGSALGLLESYHSPTAGPCTASVYVVSTLAGSGIAGFADNTGTAAQFNQPTGVAVDSSGNIYVAGNWDHRIRKITAAGVVTTLAGSGAAGSTDGSGAAAQFQNPIGVAVDSNGNVFVAGNISNRIRKVTEAGVVTTLADSGGFIANPATPASFGRPYGVAVDSSGNIYVADTDNNRIRKIDPNGVVTTLAGSGAPGSADGTSTAAQFNQPVSVVVDNNGNLYVGEPNNERIRKIDPTGVVTTLAGSTLGFADGTGTAAQFFDPYSVAVDSGSNLYVADYGNNRIRKITPAGVVTTLAGSGTAGSANGTGTAAQFNAPLGLALDSACNIYVGDSGSHLIRKLTPQ